MIVLIQCFHFTIYRSTRDLCFALVNISHSRWLQQLVLMHLKHCSVIISCHNIHKIKLKTDYKILFSPRKKFNPCLLSAYTHYWTMQRWEVPLVCGVWLWVSNINISSNEKQEWRREVLYFTPRRPITAEKIAAIFVTLSENIDIIKCLRLRIKIAPVKYLLGVKSFIVCQKGDTMRAYWDIRSKEGGDQSEASL